ncbi:phosphodiester glycosidase family protein [Paenibacillus amylolyticus]|nr:phosphodiester glycosidase family protein [Paenibacillus amylolyticus]
MSNTKLAIGQYSLYHTLVLQHSILPLMAQVIRTAIGWDRSKICLVVFQSENAYEVRRFMISRGCNLAIMLDGGDSSWMKYVVVRNANPTPASFDPGNIHDVRRRSN